MSEQLTEIKTELTEAKAFAEKVAADVTLLHTKVDSIAEQPTAEEWAEVKQMAKDLKDSLAATDAKTAEESVEQPVSEDTSTSTEEQPVEESNP